MLYLFADKKITRYARIAIYGSGVFLLGLFVYVNVFQIEQHDFIFKNDDRNSLPNFYQFSTLRPASKITAEIIFSQPDIDFTNFRALIGRTHGVILKKRNPLITDPEKLKNALNENGIPGYLTGTLIRYGKTIYLVDDSCIRPFESYKVFEAFGFDFGDVINVPENHLEYFEMGEIINEDNLSSESFPRGIILKSDDHFFLTGSKRITPIFSEEIIRQAWPSYHYIEVGSANRNRLEDMRCFIVDEKSIQCQINNPTSKSSGAQYILSLLNVPMEKIAEIKISSIFMPTWEHISDRLKDLLW